jgi:hypothetical protein
MSESESINQSSSLINESGDMNYNRLVRKDKKKKKKLASTKPSIYTSDVKNVEFHEFN